MTGDEIHYKHIGIFSGSLRWTTNSGDISHKMIKKEIFFCVHPSLLYCCGLFNSCNISLLVMESITLIQFVYHPVKQDKASILL